MSEFSRGKIWWDQWFLGLAEYASTASKDPSTKVGAVLVGTDRRNVALGYNGFPRGIKDTAERLDHRPTKYRLVQHAERNVLDNAKFECEGATLYTTLFPCCECTKSIISKGVSRLVYRDYPNREPWVGEANFAYSMLTEAGVEILKETSSA